MSIPALLLRREREWARKLLDIGPEPMPEITGPPMPPPTALQIIQLHYAYPWLVHDQFNEANFISLGAGAAFTRITFFRVPQGQLGFIAGFFNGVGDISAFDSVVWQLRVNDQGVMGYDSIQGPLGSPYGTMQPLFYPLYSNQLIEVFARNDGGVALTNITAGFNGRVFPDAATTEMLQLAAIVPTVR